MAKVKTVVTAEQAIEALKGTGGVKTTIAKRLGVSRWTINNYLDRWSTFRQAYENEKAGVDDAAVSVVMADIVNNRNVDTAKWWIARKLDEFNRGATGTKDDPVHITLPSVERLADRIYGESENDS